MTILPNRSMARVCLAGRRLLLSADGIYDRDLKEWLPGWAGVLPRRSYPRYSASPGYALTIAGVRADDVARHPKDGDAQVASALDRPIPTRHHRRYSLAGGHTPMIVLSLIPSRPGSNSSLSQIRRSKEGRNPNRARHWVSVFGFRPSAFGLLSAFGLQMLPRGPKTYPAAASVRQPRSPSPRPSPQGEGALAAVARDGGRSRFVATRPIVLPLSAGEGRGEGEQTATHSHTPGHSWNCQTS